MYKVEFIIHSQRGSTHHSMRMGHVNGAADDLSKSVSWRDAPKTTIGTVTVDNQQEVSALRRLVTLTDIEHRVEKLEPGPQLNDLNDG